MFKTSLNKSNFLGFAISSGEQAAVLVERR
jgi:hypothetical protein